MNKASTTINALSDMFHFFNKELEADLPEPIFTLIPNRGRSKYYGWHWGERWQEGNEVTSEINIAPDFLNRSVAEIAETLIHELCHYKNMLNGLKDCNAAQYHNKKFKEQAEKYGLVVSKLKGKGYAHTELGGASKDLVDRYNKEVLHGKNPFVIYRVVNAKPKIINPKKPVMVERELILEVEKAFGDKISLAVEVILQKWLGSKQ